MSIIVVSKLDLYRELIASYCMGEGIDVAGLFSSLSEITDDPLNGELTPMNVVLYVPSDADPDMLGITAFKSRFPESSIVALISSVLPASMLDEVVGRVDAAIPDDRSLQTLSSFLMVVQAGFRIAPANPCAMRMGGRLLTDHHVPTAPAGPASDGTASTPSPPPDPGLDNAIQRELSIRPDEGGFSGIVHAKLSIREKEVLRLVREGKSNKDIAKCLDIVESTVKVHLRGCLRKIGVENRTQAAVWASHHLAE